MSNQWLVTILFFLFLLEQNACIGEKKRLHAGAENQRWVSVTLQRKELVQVGEDPIHVNSLYPVLLGKNSCSCWRIILISNQWASLAMSTSLMEKYSNHLSTEALEWEQQVKTTWFGAGFPPLCEHRSSGGWRGSRKSKGGTRSPLPLFLGLAVVTSPVRERLGYWAQRRQKAFRKADEPQEAPCLSRWLVPPFATADCLFSFIQRFLRCSRAAGYGEVTSHGGLLCVLPFHGNEWCYLECEVS